MVTVRKHKALPLKKKSSSTETIEQSFRENERTAHEPPFLWQTPDVVKQEGFISARGFGHHSADSEAELTSGACARSLWHRGVSEAERTETETRLDFNSQRPLTSEPPLPASQAL